MVVKTGFCSGTEVVDIQLATFPDIITSLATWKEDGSITTETYTATRKITLLAPMFQVNYRSSDMLPIETSESSLSGSSTSSIPNASETGQDEPRESDSGLPGDKIGIIAGAAIGGFLVCAVTAWFFWRRRKRGQARISPATEDHPPPVEIHELKSHSNTTPSTLPTEMGSNPHPVELPGSVPSGARQPYS